MTTEPSLYVAVEGPTDAALIRAIVGKDISARMQVFVGRGRVSLATLGRNLLVHEGGPVLLVMDSDTRNRHKVEEMRSMARLALSGVVSGRFPSSASSPLYDVFAFVPEIAVVFFEAPDVLRRLLGDVVTEDRLREGLLSPKETLSQLLRESGRLPNDEAILSAASEPEVAEALASGKQASDLVGTIGRMMANEPVMR